MEKSAPGRVLPTDRAVEFYVAGGTLHPDAPSYVERQADHDLLEGLLRGEFCYVLTSRQMGKSSLMVRAATRLREQGAHVIALDLAAVGQNLTSEQWYNGLLLVLGRQLRIEDEMEKFWDNNSQISPLQRLFTAIREIALTRWPGSLVVFVDELDVVRSLPFRTDEFFAAIRSCYNRRGEDPELNRLTFCLLGVVTPSDLIPDARITPFNIGRRIELNDFSVTEALPLTRGLEKAGGSVRNAELALQRILYWTNGHPYLTQRLCKALAAEKGPSLRSASRINSVVDALCAELFLTPRARTQDDNLLFVRDRILRSEMDRAALLHCYKQVLKRRGVPDDETDALVGVLRLAGIMRREGDRVLVRNRIYARVFDQYWIEANMPDAEKRRQREAYLRGVVRTAGVAAVGLAIMAALVALAARSRAQARSATWAALRDQARLSRASGLAGQRFGALDSIQRAVRIKASPELRDEVIACLALPDLRKQSSRLSPLKEPARALVLSDDLQLCAFGTPSGEAVVRNALNDREISRWRTDAGAAAHLWFSHDHQYLALAHTNSDFTIVSVWRFSPPERLLALTNAMPMVALDFSPDGRQIAVGSENGARIFTLPEGKLGAELDSAEAPSVVRFDPRGRMLTLASSESLKVALYDVSSGNLVKMLHSASPPRHLAWHPQGQLLAAAGEDRRIRFWEIEADEFPKGESPQQSSEITSLTFSHSGGLLASASADQTIRLWEAGSGRLLLTLPEAGNVPQLQFSPDDRRLGFGLSNGQISFWEVEPGKECGTLFDIEADELSAMDMHPDGRLLATAHLNGVTLWDVAQMQRLDRMSVGKTASVRFHPLSGDLVSAEFRGTYRFSVERQPQAGAENLRLQPRKDFYLGPGAVALDFARDAEVLAVAYDDRIRLAKNTNSAYAALAELIGEPGFKSVATSPDGRQIAAGNWKSEEIWLWDRSNYSKPRRFRVEGHAQVRFSPNGRWLATATERMAILWETGSWHPAARVPLLRVALVPAPVAFTSNSLVWAVAVTDTRVRLLDVSGKTIADLESPHKELLVALAFSPDGSQLACATTAGFVLLWDLDAVQTGLAQLGLRTDFKSNRRLGNELSPMTVQIGALDRLRFSEARHVLGLRREIGDLTDLIHRHPEKWENYRFRAEKHRELGEYEKAIDDYQQWIELDRNSGSVTNAKLRAAWPLRDLARLYLSGPTKIRDHKKALPLTQRALELDPDNADNHFRHGIACYRSGQYREAEDHLRTARGLWESQQKNAAAILFYEAMSEAQQNKMDLATQSLARARNAYAQTDLKYRETHAQELADLLWEAQRVVDGLASAN